MDLGIHGRTALITGGGGTIGRAIARQLLDEGARVVITDLKQDAVDAARDAMPGLADGFTADLSSPDAVDRIRDACDEADIAVHAAGVTGAKGDPLEMSEDDWTHAVQTDLLSGVRLAKAVVPGMAERDWGRVIYITSENVAQAYPDETVYNASKAALLSFATSLAIAYAPRGVLVNCVAPAFIETNMTDAMMQERAEQRGGSVEEAVESFLDQERPHLVLGRRGRPEEVAAVVAMLASERASFVVGSNYRVDGGSVMALDL